MIVARGLTKRYGDKPAVEDLSFEVRPGVVTGFLGPNGAGKSTTLRLMLDLDHGSGHTQFDGRRFRDIRRPMLEIGTMLESGSFHPTRRARNHLRMLAAASSVPKSRVDEVLAMVGLTAVARKKPRTFSLGMAQRLGLAAALLGDPAHVDLGRAGERSRPARHPVAARPAEDPCFARADGAGLQPPAGRDGADGRRARGDRQGPAAGGGDGRVVRGWLHPHLHARQQPRASTTCCGP